MEKIEILGKLYDIFSIKKHKENILRIEFSQEMPEKFGNEIILFTSGGVLATTLNGWNVILLKEKNTVYLSDREEPDEIEEEPSDEECDQFDTVTSRLHKRVTDLTDQLADLQMALVEQFEENEQLREEVSNTQMALTEMFEMMEV